MQTTSSSPSLAVVNPTDSEQKFDLVVDGVRLSGNATLWQTSGKSLKVANKGGQPPQVEMRKTGISEAPRAFSPGRTSYDWDTLGSWHLFGTTMWKGRLRAPRVRAGHMRAEMRKPIDRFAGGPPFRIPGSGNELIVVS